MTPISTMELIEKRAKSARVALDSFKEFTGEGEPLQDNIVDLMTNLLHLAALEGENPSIIHGRAMLHFEAEFNRGNDDIRGKD